MKKICTNQPFLVLMQTSRAIQDRIRDDMTNFNLSITDFSVLEVLYHKEKQTIQQMAKSLLISSGSMTYVIDKLEQNGLLKRNACPKDRRVIHVTLTDRGNSLINNIMPEHKKFVDYIFESLNSSEAEDFVKLLIKVQQKLEV